MSETKPDLTSLRIDRDARPASSGHGKLLVGLAAGLVLLAGGGFALSRATRVTEVEVTTVRGLSGGAPAVLNASGYVTARRKATVAAKITGRVADIRVEEGMPVKEGQILALLDDSEWRAQLDVATADHRVATRTVQESEFNLTESDKNLRRARDLAGQGLVTEQDLDRAETTVGVWRTRLAVARDQADAAERRIAQAQRSLDNCTVRAPFSGIAVSKDAQIGEIVSPMSAGGGFTRTGISTIVDMQSLEIEVDVNESFIARVTPAQPVEATLDAYPEWRIPCRVITTIPTADRQKATVRVRIAFEKLDPRILPDMGVKVAFLEAAKPAGAAAEKPTALVAKDAVRESGGTQVVFVVNEGRLERRAVKLATVNGAEAFILVGLREGERVVVKGPATLQDGQRVRVKE
jgi:RND family efflux transporter MFP subunit